MLRLTEREQEALGLLNRFTFLKAAHFQELLLGNRALTEESRFIQTHRVLRRLRTKGYIKAEVPRRIGGRGSTAAVYRLTPQGIRALVDPVAKKRTNQSPVQGIRHALLIADLATSLVRSAREHSGHALLTFEVEREASYRFHGQMVVPDAYFVYDTPKVELTAFVEAEVTNSTATFSRKIRSYIKFFHSGAWKSLGIWPEVLVVTLNDNRALALKRAAEAIKPRPRGVEFAIGGIELVREDPLGRVWHVAGAKEPESLLATD